MHAYKYDKVLIVDDTELDCFIAEKVMRISQFARNTICINSACDALKYLDTLSENPDAVPELIFLDLNMPGMNGFQFLTEYNKLPGNIRKRSIVMLTSSILEDDKQQAMSSEYVRSFINKPISLAALQNL